MTQPQYIATRASFVDKSEALPSHIRRLHRNRYQFGYKSPSVRPRETQTSLTSEPGSAGRFASRYPISSHRRLRCPRASNSWQCSASLPPLLPVQAGKPKMTLWSLTQSPSLLSLLSQVSSSKRLPGQACAPVPPLILLHVEDE